MLGNKTVPNNAGDSIGPFTGEYRWLSNFYPVQVEYDGDTYPSVEHAYHSAKTFDKTIRNQIQSVTANRAKAIGKSTDLRSDWEQVKIEIMTLLVRRKFNQPTLRQKLLDTGNSEIVEHNNWGDVFWGVCNGKGENHLGNIIMKIRAEIRIERGFSITDGSSQECNCR